MRHRLFILSLAACACALGGCGERQRLNPFDPGNPVTGGRPPGFAALAGNSVVTLQWDRTYASGLLGYELFRRVAGETTFKAISGLIPATVTTSGDFGLQNGLDHEYQLYYVFENGKGGQPAEDVATPGPLEPRVADNGAGATVLITADGRHVRSQDASYTGPTDVAVDPPRGQVWVADTDGGNVVLYIPSLFQHSTLPAGSPQALALDPVDGSAWVCDGQFNAVLHFLNDGTPASPYMLSSISNPLDDATDPADRSLWVCERGADRVRRFTATGAPAGLVYVVAPSRVAVDSVTHAAWVTSFTTAQVTLVRNTPAVQDSFGGFSGPIGIAVDARRGRIWVADAVANQVVALQRTGAVEFRTALAGEPREIAVDLTTGNAWITLLTAGQVAVVSPAGTVIRRASGLKRPYGIALGGLP
jgi:DNA-binding beta-propeller fold protein YncE